MANVFIGVDPHRLSATIEVVDRHERVLATGRFADGQGRLRGDAPTRRRVPGPGVGGGGHQGYGAPAGAAAPRGRRDPRGRAGEAVRAVGSWIRARPQDRRPRCARGRGGRGAHPELEGARLRRGPGGAAAVGRPPRRAVPGEVQTSIGCTGCWRNWFPGQRKKDLSASQAKVILGGVRPRPCPEGPRRLALESWPN